VCRVRSAHCSRPHTASASREQPFPRRYRSFSKGANTVTEALDQFARALATGASRRAALGALLAGSAAALPFSSEAKKNKNKNKRKKKFQEFQESCNLWCDARFASSIKDQTSCIAKAKEGKGPCYSATEEGPGFYCTNILICKELICCPTLNGGAPVKDGECCSTPCLLTLNGTLICD